MKAREDGDEKELLDLHRLERLRLVEGVEELNLTNPKVKENQVEVFLHFYASRDVLIFAIRYITHQSNPVGRALGHLNSLNLGLLLLPVSRNSILFHLLKIPYEKALLFHRIQGRIFFTVTTLHGLSWYLYWTSHYFYPYNGLGATKIPSTNLIFEEFASYVSVFGQLAYMCVVLQVLFSLPIFRRNTFEIFYYLHHIFIFIVIFALIHTYLQHGGWNTDQLLYYILPGLILYLFDRLNRIYRSHFIHTDLVSLTANNSHYDNLTIIEIRRSKFKFKPGQYCFLNVPAISKFQWHPFSITSELGSENLTFHIKSYKDDSWCGKLNSLTKRLADEDEDSMDLRRGTSFMKLSFFNALDVKVDGPYGVGYFQANKFQNLLFICGGIGITPVVSIIQTLISSYENNYLDFTDNYSFNDKNNKLNNNNNNLKNNLKNNGIHDGDYNIRLRKEEKTISLLWVVGEDKNLLWFGDFLLNLKKISQSKTSLIHLKVHLFVTKKFNHSIGSKTNGIIRVPRPTPPTFKVYPTYTDDESDEGYEEDRSGVDDSFINYYEEKEKNIRRKKKKVEKIQRENDEMSSSDNTKVESLNDEDNINNDLNNDSNIDNDEKSSNDDANSITNAILTTTQTDSVNEIKRNEGDDNTDEKNDDFINYYQSDDEDEEDDEDDRSIRFLKGRPNIDRFIQNIRRNYVAQYRNVDKKIVISTLVCGPFDLEIDVLMACRKYSGTRVNSKMNLQFKFTSQTFIL